MGRSPKTAKSSPHYISGVELTQEVMKGKETGIVSARLAEMFMLLSKRISTKFRYKDEVDRDDCIMGGVEDLLRYYKNFDSRKSNNCFAYMTTICRHGQVKEFKRNHRNLIYNVDGTMDKVGVIRFSDLFAGHNDKSSGHQRGNKNEIPI